jgi:hypothetical protein
VLKFIGVYKLKRFPCNRSIFKLISDQNKMEHSYTACEGKENMLVRINTGSFIACDKAKSSSLS